MLGSCLEGRGDLISRIIMGIIGVTIWVIAYLVSPPDPPSEWWRLFKIRSVGAPAESKPALYKTTQFASQGQRAGTGGCLGLWVEDIDLC